eukprot:10847724-Ditylum_brightwellii.AAC.1
MEVIDVHTYSNIGVGRSVAYKEDVTKFVLTCAKVSRDEEVNTPAWQFSGKHLSLISADVDSTSTSQ